MEEYIIIDNGGDGLYEEKKSRFLARTYTIADEGEATGYIEAARKQYWDARHNCYAYVLGDNNEIMRFSDDGEPSGTAGKPILEVITGCNLRNCLIIVTRYFGGTLLGTGGLVRAYTKASKDALAASSLLQCIPGMGAHILTDYNGIGKIQYIAALCQAVITDTVYTDCVELDIEAREKDYCELVKKITESTNGKAVFTNEHSLPVKLPYSI